MANWYVQQPNRGLEEEFIGPLRPAELLKLVREGRVGPEDLLKKDDSAWFEAREVGGLFEAAMRPTIRLYCPECNAPVAQVPCVCPRCHTEISKARREIVENTIENSEDQKSTSQAGRSVQKWLQKKVRRKERDRP